MKSRKAQRNADLLSGLTSSALGLAGASAGLAGAWILYSHFQIDHHVPLAKAIDADTLPVTTQDAGNLNVYTDTSASGNPLVLVHSVNAAASAYEMGPIFNRFRARRPVYAIDLPGFGFSDRPDLLYTPRLYQDAILEVFHTLGLVSADVVALSLGCEFVARAAAIEPELVKSLAFISPTGFGQRAADRARKAAETGQPSNRLPWGFSVPLWSLPLYDLIATRASIRYFLQKSLVGTVPEDMVDYAYASSHQPGALHAPLYFISGRLFTKGILPAFYERLEQPVLVLYDEDAFTSFDCLPEVVKAHDNWRSVQIEPTRGLPQFEQMDRVASQLEHFWSQTG